MEGYTVYAKYKDGGKDDLGNLQSKNSAADAVRMIKEDSKSYPELYAVYKDFKFKKKKELTGCIYISSKSLAQDFFDDLYEMHQ